MESHIYESHNTYDSAYIPRYRSFYTLQKATTTARFKKHRKYVFLSAALCNVAFIVLQLVDKRSYSNMYEVMFFVYQKLLNHSLFL